MGDKYLQVSDDFYGTNSPAQPAPVVTSIENLEQPALREAEAHSTRVVSRSASQRKIVTSVSTGFRRAAFLGMSAEPDRSRAPQRLRLSGSSQRRERCRAPVTAQFRALLSLPDRAQRSGSRRHASARRFRFAARDDTRLRRVLSRSVWQDESIPDRSDSLVRDEVDVEESPARNSRCRVRSSLPTK